jgi:hypothetical protein
MVFPCRTLLEQTVVATPQAPELLRRAALADLEPAPAVDAGSDLAGSTRSARR